MRLIDNVMINIGAFFLIAGGCLLIAAVVGLVAFLVAKIWIAASLWTGCGSGALNVR